MGCSSSKQIDATTGDDGPPERKTANNAVSPEINLSTARSDRSLRMALPPDISVVGSDVKVLLPTGTDMARFKSAGRAAGWGETMPIPPRAAGRRSTHKARPDTYLDGYNPAEIPGQAPVPPLPSARSLRGSVATQRDEAPKSHRPSSTDPDRQFRLEIDELHALPLPSWKRPKRVNAWDRTGQLTERAKPIFTGGFSDVSQAKLGNRVVAVKTLRVANMEGAEDRIWKRLAREIYVWTALDHPNVLELLGFATDDGKPCLISPWCDNGTLQEYLQKFPDANRRRLVREIAEGLRYLHMQTPPIIHGDLKTTNVFVTGDYVAKISDFGGSRRFAFEGLRTGFTTSGLVLTTIRYAAPEILRDGPQPALSPDVFAFACVSLETMTDKCPFWKIPNVVAVITQVVFQRQTPSPDDHPGVEEAMWVLLRKCWSYEPSDRPHMVKVCRMLSTAGYAGFDPPPRAGPSNSRVGHAMSRPGRPASTV